jgi:hypothetical protein
LRFLNARKFGGTDRAEPPATLNARITPLVARGPGRSSILPAGVPFEVGSARLNGVCVTVPAAVVEPSAPVVYCVITTGFGVKVAGGGIGVFEVVGPVEAVAKVIMLEVDMPDVVVIEDELAADCQILQTTRWDYSSWCTASGKEDVNLLRVALHEGKIIPER